MSASESTTPHAVRRIVECVIHVAHAVSALGNDDTQLPETGEKGWRVLETAIATQLIEVQLPQQPATSDPLASVVDAVRNKRNGADTAVVVVDGAKAHGYVITNVDGTVVVFDTNIDDTNGPRVRTYEKWAQSYPCVEEAFVAYLKSDNGVLAALSEPKGIYWARRDADPRRRRIIAGSTEHHVVIDAVDWLEQHEGAQVTSLPVDAGGVVSPRATGRVGRPRRRGRPCRHHVGQQ